MAKFDYKKWVTENKYGKTNEQNTGSLDPNPANVMAMQPTGSIAGMPTGSVAQGMPGSMLKPTKMKPTQARIKRMKNKNLKRKNLKEIIKIISKEVQKLNEQNEPVSYGYNDWMEGEANGFLGSGDELRGVHFAPGMSNSSNCVGKQIIRPNLWGGGISPNLYVNNFIHIANLIDPNKPLVEFMMYTSNPGLAEMGCPTLTATEASAQAGQATMCCAGNSQEGFYFLTPGTNIQIHYVEGVVGGEYEVLQQFPLDAQTTAQSLLEYAVSVAQSMGINMPAQYAGAEFMQLISSNNSTESLPGLYAATSKNDLEPCMCTIPETVAIEADGCDAYNALSGAEQSAICNACSQGNAPGPVAPLCDCCPSPQDVAPPGGFSGIPGGKDPGKVPPKTPLKGPKGPEKPTNVSPAGMAPMPGTRRRTIKRVAENNLFEELKKTIKKAISEQRVSTMRGNPPRMTGKPNVSPAGFQGQSREEEEDPKKPKGRFWKFLGELLHVIADNL